MYDRDEDDTRVLSVLRARPHAQLTPSEVAELAELRGGRLYGALERLRRRGLVAAGWDRDRRPRQRQYWLNENSP